jgi:hypothetical protein
MRLEFSAAALLLTFGLPVPSRAAVPSYTIDEGVALAGSAESRNRDRAQKVQGARWLD